MNPDQYEGNYGLADGDDHAENTEYLECNDRRGVHGELGDEEDNESIAFSAEAQEDVGEEEGSSWIDKMSLTSNRFMNEVGVTTSSTVSPSTMSESQEGSYTQMFRSCVNLGHSTSTYVETKSGPLSVVFGTHVRFGRVRMKA